MKYQLLTVLLLNVFFSVGLTAQIIIADAETKEVFPYVTVIFLKEQKGIYTDEQGRFIVPTEYHEKDSILLQMMGYHDLRTIIASLSGTVYLTPKTYVLNEVVIRPLKVHTRIVGDLKKRRREVFGRWYDKASGKPVFDPTIIATYVSSNKYQLCPIEKLYYRYQVQDKSVSFIVRPQIYSVTSDGKPGVSLLNKSQVIELRGQGILEVNIRDEWISLPPEGIFVAMEIIQEINNKSEESSHEEPFPIFPVTSRKLETFFIDINKIYEWQLIGFPENNSHIKYPFAIGIRENNKN